MQDTTSPGRARWKLKAILLRWKNLALEIGLLRLRDSTANAVGAFTALVKTEVPKLIGR